MAALHDGDYIRFRSGIGGLEGSAKAGQVGRVDFVDEMNTVSVTGFDHVASMTGSLSLKGELLGLVEKIPNPSLPTRSGRTRGPVTANPSAHRRTGAAEVAAQLNAAFRDARVSKAMNRRPREAAVGELTVVLGGTTHTGPMAAWYDGPRPRIATNIGGKARVFSLTKNGYSELASGPAARTNRDYRGAFDVLDGEV